MHYSGHSERELWGVCMAHYSDFRLIPVNPLKSYLWFVFIVLVSHHKHSRNIFIYDFCVDYCMKGLFELA